MYVCMYVCFPGDYGDLLPFMLCLIKLQNFHTFLSQVELIVERGFNSLRGFSLKRSSRDGRNPSLVVAKVAGFNLSPYQVLLPQQLRIQSGHKSVLL